VSSSDLLPHLVNGISLGLLFALIALRFMLILGVMEVINLAHGSLFALGAYLALTLLSRKPARSRPTPPGSPRCRSARVTPWRWCSHRSSSASSAW
jgi:branched-chain amino acid transport system permease protein